MRNGALLFRDDGFRDRALPSKSKRKSFKKSRTETSNAGEVRWRGSLMIFLGDFS